MAIRAQPVDGLIYRLLHQNQNSKSSGVESRHPASADDDHVNISSQTRDQLPMHSVESSVHAPNGSGGRSLESHLLSLCKSND